MLRRRVALAAVALGTLAPLTGTGGFVTPAVARGSERTKPQSDAGAGGVIRTVAGSNQRGFSGDGGSAVSAAFDQPRSATVGPDGTVFISDTFNHRVRRVDPGGAVTTLAGTGQAAYSGDGGPAGAATLHWPHGLAVDPTGAALYIADSANHRIRRVDLASDVITTVAGGPAAGSAGDGGPAAAAQLEDPKGVWVAPSGEIYIADSGNERIRRIDRSGTITTVAGTGVTGFAGDGGPALAAQFDGPRAIAGDGAGNLYVADDNNHRIRRIDPTGMITTVAGTGTGAFAGDGGPAAAAQLNHPRGVAVDDHGDVFVADSMNHRIRMIDPEGQITTVAGCGRQGFGGDGGPATTARLFEPRGVAVDSTGHLFVADTYNDRVRRVDDPRPGAPSSKCRA